MLLCEYEIEGSIAYSDQKHGDKSKNTFFNISELILNLMEREVKF